VKRLLLGGTIDNDSAMPNYARAKTRLGVIANRLLSTVDFYPIQPEAELRI